MAVAPSRAHAPPRRPNWRSSAAKGNGDFLINRNFAWSALDHVRRGDSCVLEDDFRIGSAALAGGVDHVVGNARRSSFDHNCRQALPAAGPGIGADDHQVEMRATAIPACDVTRPVLATVQDIVVTIERRRDCDTGSASSGRVEVRCASRRSGRLTRRIADDELTGLVGGCGPDKSLLLLLGTVIPYWHQAEPVH